MTISAAWIQWPFALTLRRFVPELLRFGVLEDLTAIFTNAAATPARYLALDEIWPDWRPVHLVHRPRHVADDVDIEAHLRSKLRLVWNDWSLCCQRVHPGRADTH
jgi:hypothetical protein